MNDLIKQFNTKETLVVVTSYPIRNGEPAKQNAVACYAQNLLNHYKGKQIVILSEFNDGYESQSRRQIDIEKKGNLIIYRCWKPGSPLLYLQLIKALKNFGKTRKIVFQFEFNMLGSMILTALLPFWFFTLKLTGRQVVVIQHQVVDNLASLSGHLNIRPGTLKNFIFTNGLHLFYTLVGLLADKIIVHEEALKERLSGFVNPDKLKVISHGLALEKLPESLRLETRKKLGIGKDSFVLLVFGYLAWYKGTDWIIEKINKIHNQNPHLKLKLVVAGGPSATLSSKAHYRGFVAKVKRLAAQNVNLIKLTGFVAEGDVKSYFAASDLVVLPYRAMMSASGPLSFALRFNKPFIVSKTLQKAFLNRDAGSVLTKLNIGTGELAFSLKGLSFNKLVGELSGKGELYEKLNILTSTLREKRDWKNIVEAYKKVTETEKYPAVRVVTQENLGYGGVLKRGLAENRLNLKNKLSGRVDWGKIRIRLAEETDGALLSAGRFARRAFRTFIF